LLKKLTERMGTAQLARLLPQTAKQIERLAALKDSVQRTAGSVQYAQFAIPLVFFVTKQQREIIENVIETAFSVQRTADRTQMTKAQRRAEAITAIAEHYLAGRKAVLSVAGPENAGLQNKATLV
jgi:hypothetical protein